MTIDFSVFQSILRELKSIRRELQAAAGKPIKKPVAKRDLRDAVFTSDVLRILKVSPATLNGYEKKGLIKFHKEGTKKVYSEAEVRAFKSSKGRRKRLTQNVLRERFNAA